MEAFNGIMSGDEPCTVQKLLCILGWHTEKNEGVSFHVCLDDTNYSEQLNKFDAELHYILISSELFMWRLNLIQHLLKGKESFKIDTLKEGLKVTFFTTKK